MGTASTTPLPAGEPRNRAGKEKVGGALGNFHLYSASSIFSHPPSPTKPGFWGLQHIKGIRGGEALRLADSASSLHYEWGN